MAYTFSARSFRVCCALLVVGGGVWSVGGAAVAGPLNPPAGAIVSTNKTLAEVEPRRAINAVNTPGNPTGEFVISQPGSYYLTGDIVTAKPAAIVVSVGSVNIDLCGFNVTSSNPSSFTIISASGVAALNIHDGRLTASNGVNGTGIFCNGDQTVLRRLSITCGGQAVSTSINSVVEDVAVSSNDVGAVSIGCGKGAQVRRVSVNGAGGIDVAEGSVVEGCGVRVSRGFGIRTYFDCTVSGCTVMQSAGHGITVADGTTITGCTSGVNGGYGIAGTSGCTLIDCTSRQNTGVGIAVTLGSRLSGCVSSINSQSGIELNDGSTASNCVVRGNTLDGILVTSHCTVSGNNCSSNGQGAGVGAGIRANGGSNRLEGNDCSLNDKGVETSFFNNMVIKCSCSGNSVNWVIGAGNICGPFLDRTSTGAAGFSGNAGPSSLGTTDPNANFTY